MQWEQILLILLRRQPARCEPLNNNTSKTLCLIHMSQYLNTNNKDHKLLRTYDISIFLFHRFFSVVRLMHVQVILTDTCEFSIYVFPMLDSLFIC